MTCIFPPHCSWCIAFHKWTVHQPLEVPFPIKTSRQISFPASQYLQDSFKIRLTRLPCLKAIPLSFPRLRNIETLSNLFRSVLLLSPGKWYFISPIMHADVATQAAGSQPLYQGDDAVARSHIKVGGWVSSLMCVCVCTCGIPVMCMCLFYCVSEPLCFWLVLPVSDLYLTVAVCVFVCVTRVCVCVCMFRFVFGCFAVSERVFLCLCMCGGCVLRV